MAARPIWRGHLRLALVSCPVALYIARHDRVSIRFNLINPDTGNRIRMVTQDAETGRELSRSDTVKGYEFKKNHYLILTDEDFESVRVESSAMMTVDKFVDAGSIDPIYYDASYYLAPDGRGADDIYAVLRTAILRTGKVALARVVISQRERTVALRSMDGGLVAQTLNQQRDLNSYSQFFEGIDKIEVDPEMVKLAVQLLDRQAGTYDPSDLEDRYETRLRAMIDAKLKGEGVTPEPQEDTRSDVFDLMTVLKKSLSEPLAPEATPAAKRASKQKGPTPDQIRRQPGFRLPIEGGKKASEKCHSQCLPSRPAGGAQAQRRDRGLNRTVGGAAQLRAKQSASTKGMHDASR
jgi:DNA end-binding protein Ku